MSAPELAPVAESSAQRVYWSKEEQEALLLKCAEKLLGAGFTAENWNEDANKRDQVEELFLQAQREALAPDRFRERSEMWFGTRYRTIIGRIPLKMASMAAERRMIAERAGVSIEQAMNGAASRIIPGEQVVAAPPGEQSIPETVAFPGAAPHVPPPPVPYPTHLISVEVKLAATEQRKLDDLREEMELIIDELKQIRSRMWTHEARLNDIAANPQNAAIGKIKRIAYVGKHRQHFLKIQGDLKALNLPIALFWVDSEKNPTQVFADYAIMTTECSHKWTNKVKESIGPSRFYWGNSNSERCADMIKMWLKESEA